METEAKFLDVNYVETRIREFKDIRSRQVAFKVERSNRENSNSIYVRFYLTRINKGEERFFAGSGVRISDHYLNDYPHKQFIVDTSMPLTKGRKAIFIKTLEKALKLTIKTSFMVNLNNLSKNTETAQESQILE